jgi:hypothetical protein
MNSSQIMMVPLIICVHLTVHTAYCKMCIGCTSIYSLSSKNLFTQIFIVQLFSNRFFLISVIIVHYPNTGNVYQVFQSCNQYHYIDSINIIHHKIYVWFRLSMGILKAYCHHSRKPGYTEPISLTGSKWARHICHCLSCTRHLLNYRSH